MIPQLVSVLAVLDQDLFVQLAQVSQHEICVKPLIYTLAR